MSSSLYASLRALDQKQIPVNPSPNAPSPSTAGQTNVAKGAINTNHKAAATPQPPPTPAFRPVLIAPPSVLMRKRGGGVALAARKPTTTPNTSTAIPSTSTASSTKTISDPSSKKNISEISGTPLDSSSSGLPDTSQRPSADASYLVHRPCRDEYDPSEPNSYHAWKEREKARDANLLRQYQEQLRQKKMAQQANFRSVVAGAPPPAKVSVEAQSGEDAYERRRRL